MVEFNELINSETIESITVKKHLEVNLDAGTLLVSDPNVLDQNSLQQNTNDYLLNLTRDNVQLLYNHIWELPTERVEEAIVVKLPPSKFILPRSKPVPKPKSLTKWQQFAKDKGIQKKKKSKLTWDDQLKKWVPRFGFKKAKAEKDKNWVIEVPGNADPMEDQFLKKKIAKGERVAKNELQRLRNIAKAKNVKIPRFGLVDPDKSSSKELQAAVTISKSSTASVGKFQEKLPKEKEARGVAAINPGASRRKRKLPPVSGEEERTANREIVESILNKRPRLNVNEAVDRRIHLDQITSSKSDNSVNKKSKKKSGPTSKKGGPSSKKGGGVSQKSGRVSKKSGSKKRRR